jgi:hypothetical protein
LGDKNPKWKEWWQTIQEFMEELIQESIDALPSSLIDSNVSLKQK